MNSKKIVLFGLLVVLVVILVVIGIFLSGFKPGDSTIVKSLVNRFSRSEPIASDPSIELTSQVNDYQIIWGNQEGFKKYLADSGVALGKNFYSLDGTHHQINNINIVLSDKPVGGPIVTQWEIDGKIIVGIDSTYVIENNTLTVYVYLINNSYGLNNHDLRDKVLNMEVLKMLSIATSDPLTNPFNLEKTLHETYLLLDESVANSGRYPFGIIDI